MTQILLANFTLCRNSVPLKRQMAIAKIVRLRFISFFYYVCVYVVHIVSS